MARTVITNEKIKEINDLYYVLGVKAQVAREMGISASTVSKYIIDGYIPEEMIEREEVDLEEMRSRIEEFILDLKTINPNSILALTEEEKEEIEDLWKEMTI